MIFDEIIHFDAYIYTHRYIYIYIWREREREREREETDIGVKRVFGVSSFGGFAIMLEEEEAIEVVLRELHGH